MGYWRPSKISRARTIGRYSSVFWWARCVQLNLLAASLSPSAYMAGYLTPLQCGWQDQGGASACVSEEHEHG
jgi:hypothetical protein